jgi:hypothetical protein
MSRCDQWIGLNDWGREFLRRNALAHEQIMEVEGAWAPVVGTLERHTLRDGRQLEEYQQATPWQSGPMYFLALRDSVTGEPVSETLWTEEELEGDGRWYTWTPERAYLEALTPAAEELARYLDARSRDDEIGAYVYRARLDTCLEVLAYHESECDVASLRASELLSGEWPQLLVALSGPARALREREIAGEKVEALLAEITPLLARRAVLKAATRADSEAELAAGSIDD